MPFLKRRLSIDDDGFFTTRLPASSVVEDSLHTTRLDQHTAIVTRANGKLVAFSAVCPHAAADLSKGRIARGQIKCVDHGYTFDVRTGRASWPPDEGCHLTRFQVRVKDGFVQIQPNPG